MGVEETFERWSERPFALSQDTHRQINSRHYPGTRQMCVICDQPTGRTTGEDSMYNGDEGPVCEECHREDSGD